VEKPFTEASRWGTTFAYTYTSAKNNRDINEHYALDQPSLSDYPFILSPAAPRHRLVTTGTFRAPWGITLAGKVTLATPTPKNDIACFQAPGQFLPTGSSCTPIAATPRNTLGYKTVDLQVSKSFQFGGATSMYVRFDALNVFNWKNYNDYLLNWGQNGIPNPDPVRFNPIGNIVGVPRTFKATMGVKF